MKDHSAKAYLQRLSTEELEAFLWQCGRLRQWSSYAYVIPMILSLLQARGHAVPEPILTAWEAHQQTIIRENCHKILSDGSLPCCNGRKR